MDTPTRLGVFLALLTATAAPVAAQSSDSSNSAHPSDPAASPQAAAPAGAADLAARGDIVFHGAGNCYACHGSKGEGLVGPNLTDAEWIHSKGTYEEIVTQINHGVAKEESKSGIAMPAKGGGTISDDDVKAVAAYVFSLSHR